MKWERAGALDRTFMGSACAIAGGSALAVGRDGKYASNPASFIWRFSTRSWHRTEPLPELIAPAPGALVSLANGAAALVGGRSPADPRPITLGTVHLFDPVERTWRRGRPMVDVREYFAAAASEDGRLVVAGGRGADQASSLATVEAYDPEADTWSRLPDMPERRDEHRAVRLTDGRILIAGGFSGDASSRATFLLNRERSEWTVCGVLNVARKNHALVALPDGRAAVIGGWAGRAGDLDSIEVFDPIELRWQLGGLMLEKRKKLAATLLPDGRVLVVGGTQGDGEVVTTFASTEIWDPRNGHSVPGPTMRRARYDLDLLALGDGRLLAVGGVLDEPPLTELLALP